MGNNGADFSKAAVSAAIAVGLMAAPGAASAKAAGFTFRAAEYAPAPARDAAVQAFMASHVTPGVTVAAALASLRAAGAACGVVQGGALRCASASVEQLPDEDLSDVSWVVTITPVADKTVASASVERIKSGF
jgi:hypothetical protein